MEIENKLNSEISEDYKQALAVHTHIVECGKTAVTAIAQIGKNLKEIRDKKLYVFLGFESFKDYTENNGDYSFKERQAYNYIKLYEENSDKFLQDNASLGITKLTLLNQISAFERQDFIDENKIAGMTVKEIEQLIAEHKKVCEQLTFFTTESEKSKEVINNSENENQELKNEIERLSAEIKELESRPIEVPVRELSDEELAQIKESAMIELQNEHDEEIQKIIKENQSEFEKIQAEHKNDILKSNAKIEELKEKLQKQEQERIKLETKLKSGTKDEVRATLKVYFEETQKSVMNFVSKISEISDDETKAKFKSVTAKWLTAVVGELGK